jgi:hypothetical protein
MFYTSAEAERLCTTKWWRSARAWNRRTITKSHGAYYPALSCARITAAKPTGGLAGLITIDYGSNHFLAHAVLLLLGNMLNVSHAAIGRVVAFSYAGPGLAFTDGRRTPARSFPPSAGAALKPLLCSMTIAGNVRLCTNRRYATLYRAMASGCRIKGIVPSVFAYRCHPESHTFTGCKRTRLREPLQPVTACDYKQCSAFGCDSRTPLPDMGRRSARRI